MSDFIKKPCQHCPFKISVRPFLHPDRAYDIANSAGNPYSSFPCHKTTTQTEEDEGYVVFIDRHKEQECAGFLTMRANLGDDWPEGFEPDFEGVYESPEDMYYAYKDAGQ